ncbi:MAG TPA: GNAT family N-acetyltransferase [Burkholderiaceae bacterium]|jgi:GNAT superfamily N-acetyltransferase|nr:GNAT family N-acetyltransferase [Burkholderiaceae bacterium]
MNDTHSSLRIEPARPQHAAVLLSLVRDLARFEKLEHQVVASEEQIRDELAASRPVIEASIAWDGADAVGFALYFHNFSTFLGRRGLYLEDLYVVPHARRRGIGRTLIAHVASIAVARRCGRFDWAVLDWNQHAIDFYRSLGAEVLPDWRICRVTGDALARLGRDGTMPDP